MHCLSTGQMPLYFRPFLHGRGLSREDFEDPFRVKVHIDERGSAVNYFAILIDVAITQRHYGHALKHRSGTFSFGKRRVVTEDVADIEAPRFEGRIKHIPSQISGILVEPVVD